MKSKIFYNCHFQTEFAGVQDKRLYRNEFLSKNSELALKEVDSKGFGFKSLPLNYDPFEGFNMKIAKSIKLASANYATHVSYSFIIEKEFYNNIVRRFNLGKCQVLDLKDKLVDTENDYYFQDLKFKECEYKYYNSSIRDFVKTNIFFNSKDEFINHQREIFGNLPLNIRVDKYVFEIKYYDYDMLILNEVEFLPGNLKFSAKLMEYVKEQKVKCLFADPFEVYYT
jgi:hypothetical protein